MPFSGRSGKSGEQIAYMTRRVQAIVLLIPPVLAGAVLAAGLYVPGALSHAIAQVSPGCIFRRLTGLACPGCGGTRAARALLAGDVWGACKLNFFLIPSLLLLLVEYVRRVLVFFSYRDITYIPAYIRVIQAYAVLTVAWFVLRNVFGI